MSKSKNIIYLNNQLIFLGKSMKTFGKTLSSALKYSETNFVCSLTILAMFYLILFHCTSITLFVLYFQRCARTVANLSSLVSTHPGGGSHFFGEPPWLSCFNVSMNIQCPGPWHTIREKIPFSLLFSLLHCLILTLSYHPRRQILSTLLSSPVVFTRWRTSSTVTVTTSSRQTRLLSALQTSSTSTVRSALVLNFKNHLPWRFVKHEAHLCT